MEPVSNPSSITSCSRLNDDDLKTLRANILRRRNAMRLIALNHFTSAIPDLRHRLNPFLEEAAAEMKWTRLFREGTWNSDETLALQWLRSIWEEKMHLKSREYGGFFPDSFEMRKAVFCALAEANFLMHLIDDYYKKPRSTPDSVYADVSA